MEKFCFPKTSKFSIYTPLRKGHNSCSSWANWKISLPKSIYYSRAIYWYPQITRGHVSRDWKRVSKFLNFDMRKLQKPNLFNIIILYLSITSKFVIKDTTTIWFDGQWGLQVYPLSLQKTYVTSPEEFSTLLELRGEVCLFCQIKKFPPWVNFFKEKAVAHYSIDVRNIK